MLYFTTFREGFDLSSIGASIGEYDYLKPVDPATVLDETTEADFRKVFSETITPIYPEWSLGKVPTLIASLKTYASAEEFKYYIQNKKWPYGSYLTNYLTNNKDNVLKSVNSITVTTTEQVQQIFPTRFFYGRFIMSTESKQSPLPVSNDIFTGKAQPPTSISPTTSSSSLSPDNYTKLKSICSSI